MFYIWNSKNELKLDRANKGTIHFAVGVNFSILDSDTEQWLHYRISIIDIVHTFKHSIINKKN